MLAKKSGAVCCRRSTTVIRTEIQKLLHIVNRRHVQWCIMEASSGKKGSLINLKFSLEMKHQLAELACLQHKNPGETMVL